MSAFRMSVKVDLGDTGAGNTEFGEVFMHVQQNPDCELECTIIDII